MEISPDFFLEVLCLTIYDDTLESTKLAKAAVDIYELDIRGKIAVDDELTKLYTRMIREIVTTDIDLSNPGEVSKLLLQFQNNNEVMKDETILTKIKEIIEGRENVSIRRITNMRKKVKNWVVWAKSSSNIRRMFTKINQCSNASDEDRQDMLLNDVLEASRDLAKAFESTANGEDATLDFIDISCIDSIKQGLNKHKKKKANKGYQVGLQGLERMFGENKGPLPGEFIGIAALSHNYKSGLLMDFARWMVTLNEPRNTDGNTPCVVFISLENEVHENMMQWFKTAYINIFKKEPLGLSDEETIKQVYEIYNKKGIKLLVYRKVGELFGYEDWAALHIQLMEQGYHIMASILDYITPMKLEDSGVFEAKKIQRLCHKMKTFADQNGITVITAMQLGTLGMDLARSGQTNVVGRFTSAHLAECKSARQEFDVFIYSHIEKNHLDIPYLTLCIDKHRYVNNTPEEHKRVGYKFRGKLGILNDIHGKDKSVRDIYTDDDDDEDNTTTEEVVAQETTGVF